jgi:outer membrane lipoprotein-sorting protein
MWITPLLLAAALNANDAKEAEKAFQEMSDKVTKAKTFECAFEVKVEGAKAKGGGKGTLIVTEGNQLRIELGVEQGGQPLAMLIVSDGAKTVTVANKKAQPATDAPKDQAKKVLPAVARCGAFVPLFLAAPQKAGEKPEEVDPDAVMKVSDFRLGKKEKVGGAEAQAVEYTLSLVAGEKKIPLACTVWLDTKSRLPVKRVLTGMEGGDNLTVTETYSKVTVDGKVGEKTFELPKE